MLMWETASMCVLLGGKSNKATVVFPVLPKFYQHTYPIKCPPPPPPWEGTYFNIVVFVRKMVLHQNNFWNANVRNSINVCALLGGESNKATAVFPVLTKFYEHTNPIKCHSPLLGKALIRILWYLLEKNGIISKQFLEC